MRTLARKILWKLYKPIKPVEINHPIYYQLKHLPQRRLNRIIHGIISRNYEQKSNERTVEMPFVFSNIRLQEGAKILDFGCADSKLPIELASLGYKVNGTDLRKYSLKHPNFTFTQGDFRRNSIQDKSFDAITAVSSIEHCGFSDYGEEEFENGDYEIIKGFHRILKPKGALILTVPFGKRGRTRGYRVYDYKQLLELLRDFKIKKEEFYIGKGRDHWIPSTAKELETLDSIAAGFVQGVACIVAEKI